MGIPRSKPDSARTALNAQQRRSMTRSPGRDVTNQESGVGTTSPEPGPRTSWTRVEAKFQQGANRSRNRRVEKPEREIAQTMRKAARGRPGGATMASEGLKARKTSHSGVSRKHQTGTS